MTLVITSKSFCFVAGRPCSAGDIEQLLAAIIGLGLLVWVTQAAKGKPLAEQPGALLRGLRDVAFLIPVPFVLWYDSLHPNVTVRIFAIALVLTEVQDIVRRRHAQRTREGKPKKPISARKAAEGYSLIVDPRRDGGYLGWSVEDDNLKVAAPSLLGIDEATRSYIREGLGGGSPLELTLAYVWDDAERATPAASADIQIVASSRPPKSLYLEVRESEGNGYVAEGKPDLRISAPTLDELAPAARAEIGRRWRNASRKDMPKVTFAWVRKTQV
jgi:hypothetical protein